MPLKHPQPARIAASQRVPLTANGAWRGARPALVLLAGVIGLVAPASGAQSPSVPSQGQGQSQSTGAPTPATAASSPSTSPSTSPPASTAPSAQDPALVKAAETAARAWLDKLDAGNYRDTWETAAAPFRKAITADDWSTKVDTVRKATGPLQDRLHRSARYTRTLPGAPDGDYVLIQNDTRFQQKGAAIETVTMMREADGVWRLAGYFIR